MPSTTTENEYMDFNIRGVPADLQKRFKELCVRERKTLREKVIELMQSAVDQDRGKVK